MYVEVHISVVPKMMPLQSIKLLQIEVPAAAPALEHQNVLLYPCQHIVSIPDLTVVPRRKSCIQSQFITLHGQDWVPSN